MKITILCKSLAFQKQFTYMPKLCHLVVKEMKKIKAHKLRELAKYVQLYSCEAITHLQVL